MLENKFDFNFPSTTGNNDQSNEAPKFNFEWNTNENSFSTQNNTFMETKSSFEAKENLFAASNNDGNTFGKISSENKEEGLNFAQDNDDNDDSNQSDTLQTSFNITPLKEEQTTTGEEEEEKLFSERAKLFVLVTENENKSWKERGIGKLTINKNKEGNSRFGNYFFFYFVFFFSFFIFF